MKATPWLFLAPNLAIIALFSLAPVLINVMYSVTGTDNLYPGERTFVGLANFADAPARVRQLPRPATCSRDLFWRAVRNAMVFVPTQVAAMIGIALATAVALNRDIRARGFFRGVFFFPVMLSPVVVAMTWLWLLQRQTGR